MRWVALRMLMGDRGKFLGLIFGVAFATLLMSQQVSIFMGILTRTASQILDVRDADIWVMDNKVRFIDEVPPLADGGLQRVRGVPGVAWAVKFYKAQLLARLEDGNSRSVIMMGIDDATFVGAPAEMIRGELSDLRQPDAIIVDKAGYEYMWPNEPYKLGREIQINERRAVLVGICKASAPFTTLPILYAKYSTAANFAPKGRRMLTCVLAKPVEGLSGADVCRRIEKQTGLMALTQEEFFWKTIFYFLGSTGIPVNFGITITLGFIVGAAVTGQTFYLFTVENLRQFGALKAMGVTNRRLIGMILLQGLLVGCIGFGIGIGLTAFFFVGTSQVTVLAGLYMTMTALVGTGSAVLIIIMLTALASIHRVLVLEPAVVFRG